MTEIVWKTFSGAVDPHQNKATLHLMRTNDGIAVLVNGIPAAGYPSGEPAQQKRLREDAAAILRQCADWLSRE